MAKVNKLLGDVNQRAKGILDRVTGEIPPEPDPSLTPLQKAASAMGKVGGKKGGVARAQKLTPQQRSEIAKKAAAARWGKKK